MGSLRHGALPQAGAKTASKSTRMSAAPQSISNSDVNNIESKNFLNLNDLTSSRLNAMSPENQLKAVSNDTVLNSSITNKKDMISKKKLLYPKNSIANETFTVTNKEFPEMNEAKQSILTPPKFIGPEVDNKVVETENNRGIGTFSLLGFDYISGKKGKTKGNSEVTVKQDPVTGSTIGDLQNNEIKNAYNAFNAEKAQIILDNKNN